MKVKKIIERIFKVINIILNAVMGVGCIVNFMHYASIGAYVYSDDINRLPLVLWSFVIINIADHLIRKVIREF